MVILFIIGLSILRPDADSLFNADPDDRYTLMGESGLDFRSIECPELPLDLDRAVSDELTQLPGISYATVHFELTGKQITSRITPIARTKRWEWFLSRHPGELTWRRLSPLTIKVRLKADQRWGDDAPSHPLGPPYSSTERVTVAWRNWGGGVSFDRDRYESRMNDLSRGWIQYGDAASDFVIGDFNARMGQGATFWSTPSYFSPEGAAGEGSVRFPQVSHASSLRANAATRGVAGAVRFDQWSMLLGGGSTKLDATVASDGRRLNLSDGGLHRTTGESLKRESLREDMVIAGFQRELQLNDHLADVGMGCWEGKYTPALQPDNDIDNPFPQRGSRAGAVGVFGDFNFSSGEVSLENSWDLEGNAAQRGRIVLVKSYRELKVTDRESPIEYASAWFPDDFSARLTAYRFPPDYNNPHARTLAGREAKNLQGVSVTTEERGGGILNSIKVSAGVEERIWRTAADPSPPVYSYGILEVKFPTYNWTSRLRLSRRNGDEPEVNVESDGGSALRAGVTRIRYSTYGAVDKWAPNPIGDYQTLHFWGEVAIRDGITEQIAAAGSSALTVAGAAMGRKWKTSVGMDVFDTPTEVPIYTTDVSPPDVFASVRLAGSGARIWGEISVGMGERGALLMRASRVIPFGGGAKASGSLYLTFNQKWGKGI